MNSEKSLHNESYDSLYLNKYLYDYIMRRNLLLIISLLLGIGIYAQDSLIAYYPLLEDGKDITGNGNEMMLTNAVFQNGGVYSNGIYYGNNTSGTEIRCPGVSGFNFDDFTVSLEFMIEEYPGFRTPIIIAGNSWRWMGTYVEDNQLAFMANDGSVYEKPGVAIAKNQWYKLTFNYSKAEAKARFYLNDDLVFIMEQLDLEHNNDGIFSNQHAGSGETFMGYWKNLQYFNRSHLAGIKTNKEFDNVSTFINSSGLIINDNSNLRGLKVKLYDIPGNELYNFKIQKGTNTIKIPDSQKIIIVLLYDEQGNSISRKLIVF